MKHLKNSMSLFLWMLFGSLVGIAVSTAVFELYRFLDELLPKDVLSYDIASGDKFFDSLYTSLWLISLFITLFISVYLSLRYDNSKFEFIITKTEGLYKIPEVLPTYISNYAVSDICSSIINGIIYTVPFFFIPMPFIKNESFLAKLSEPYKTMSECFGYVLSPILMIIMLSICYAASVLLALKYYRARWFSAFSEV